MLIKSEANPLGTVRRISEFEKRISFLKIKWDHEVQNNPKVYNFRFIKTINLNVVTNFLLECLDDLVITIDNLLENGPDKKATVLNALDRIYDYVLKEGMPIWLRPIAAPLKNYIIYILISNSIDWIVNKYKKKEWNKKEVKNG